MKLYVGNMSFDMDEHTLAELFQNYGAVNSAKIIFDRETGRSRGFGFVEMESKPDAEKAIAELAQSTVNGRELVVNEARPRKERY